MSKAARVLKSTFGLQVAVVAATLGLATGAYYVADSKSAIHEYVFCPLIRSVTDAEEGHRLGIFLMKYGF